MRWFIIFTCRVRRRRVKLVGYVTHKGEIANTEFVNKPEGGRQLGRPKHKWEDNIKLNLEE
jgi:hypothetical protein